MFPRVTTTVARPCRLRVAGVVFAAAAVMSATACATDGTTTATPTSAASSAATVHNAADVTFSRDMIPHHRQAVEMAELAPTRSSDPRVGQLATQIAAGQGPEIDELVGRLRSWGETVPDDSSGDHSAMDHSAMDHSEGSMAGMMSASDMAGLAGLAGPEFDRKWLSMMIEHHTGAIAMARTELADGTDRDSKALATDIVAAQQSEIARMRSILGG
ncbi:DUF305 domain-containing protein [Williamsia phyllosphaerae]|uniref:DUF305 domain-containing protein n=1 Tax=Williamsia phyllosphaerae TaxID=885042 RepID=A0ABQ1U8V9_9NOCA|nr:DUF305 domain-containing protein [Williamsia phyllosphaerae]GGF13357.1 hypothetical protein GCM10007298_06670 [Williamsia phyllosphaerae]